MNVSRYRTHILLMLLASILLPMPAKGAIPKTRIPRQFSLAPQKSTQAKRHTRRRIPKNMWAFLPFIDWKDAPEQLYAFCENTSQSFRGDPLPRPIPAVGLINTYDAVTEATHLATAETLVKRDASGNFASNVITATSFVGDLTGNASSATNFSGSLAGDVTGTQSATVVAYVGGETAENVANATNAVMNATYEATPDTLVARDSSGDVEFNQITGGWFEFNAGGRFSSPFGGEGIYVEPDVNLEYGATLSIANPANTKRITIQAPATMASDFTLTLPNSAGTNGYALTTDGTGVLGWTDFSTPSNAILQGGNSFTEAITIGTSDYFALNLKTYDTTRMTITNDGAVSTTGNLSAGGTLGCIGNFAVATNKFTVNATNGTTTVYGPLTASNGLTVSYSGATINDGITVTGNSSIDGDVTLKDHSALRFAEYVDNGTNAVIVYPPISMAADYAVTLPATLGGDGYALTTDQYGNLSWTDLSLPSGIILQGGNAFGQALTIGTNDNQALNLETGGSTHLSISYDGDLAFNTTQLTIDGATGNASLSNTLTTGGKLTVSAGGLDVTGNGTIAGNLALENQGELQLIENSTYGTNYVALRAPEDLANPYTLTFPADAGTNGYALTTNGSGTLSWTDVSAPSGTILQGGNSFTEAITIGTSDYFALNLKTNDTNRLTITNDGAISTTGNLTVGGTLSSTGDFAVATNKFTVAATTGNTAVGGTLSSASALTVSANGANITGNTNVTGTLEVSSTTTIDGILYPSGGMEAEGTGSGGSGILNIGTTDETDTLNLGTGTTAQTINLGTGAGASAINIGSSGDTINIYGDTYYNHVTQLQVTDKLITINKGGIASSGNNSGIDIEEASAITGYAKTDGSATSWLLKAPASNGIVTITPGSGGFTLNQGVATTDSPTFTGVTISAQGDLILQDSDSSNYIALQAPATITSDITLTLPDTAGTNEYALTTNGSGVLNWSPVAHDGGNTLGAALTLGTNDTYALNLETDGNTRITISDAGAVSTTGNLSVGGTLSSTGNFAVNTDKFTVAASDGATTIDGVVTAAEKIITKGLDAHSVASGGDATLWLGYSSANTSFINLGTNITANPGSIDIGNNSNVNCSINTYAQLNAYKDVTITENLSVSKNFSARGTSFTVSSSNINMNIPLTTSNNITVNTDKFVVTASSGNTSIGGTLNVTSTVNSTGNFTVNTDKFAVTASSGNTSLAGDLTIPATTSTVGAIKAGSDLLLHTYNTSSNLFVGRAAGNRSGSGTANTGCGYTALEDFSSGSNNTAVGSQALRNLTTGTYNTAVGDQAMTGIVTGSENIAVAHRALEDITSGARNIGIGNASLANVTTGSYNTAIGHTSGMNLGTGGNYNIYLGYRQLGLSGDSGITRIGSFTDASANATSKCFIQGIRDVTTDNSDREVVGIDTSHQLGTEGAMKVGSSGYLPAVPLPSATTPRILYGRVDSAGDKINGSDGWTVSRISDPGQYRVSFSSSFSAVPTAVATIGDQSISNNFMIQITNESTSSVDIYIFVPGVNFYNNAFNFQVIGY